MKFVLFLLVFVIEVMLPLTAEENPLELRTLEGTGVSLSDYAGKNQWLLVMIWATDCSVCFKEMPKISRFHSDHTGSDLSVIGVALDGYAKQAEVAAFVARNELTFPNLVAEMPAFALRYEFEVGEKLYGTPTYLLFNPAGELVANNPGPVRAVALEEFIAR